MDTKTFADRAIAHGRTAGVNLCLTEVEAFAAALAAEGVLEEARPEERHVEVEGVEVEGPDEEGDLFFETPDHNGYVEASLAGSLARALLAWVAGGNPPQPEPQAREGRRVPHAADLGRALLAWAGEAQPEAQAAPQGTRERPYIWRRKTESGGTEEVPVWLEQSPYSGGIFLWAGNPATGKAIAATFSRNGGALLTDYHGKKLFNHPQPQAAPADSGEVLLRLTREEARALTAFINDAGREEESLDSIWTKLRRR